MSVYSSLLTTTGAAQYAYNEANALATVLSQVALGDNNGAFFTPTINDGAIVHQVNLASINSITVDPIDSTIDNVEVVLPYNIGGWIIREFRILDSNGTVMYTGNCEIAKSILSSGQAIETQIIFPIKRVNTAAVTLNFDSSLLATFQYVTNAIATHNNDVNAHGAAAWATKVGVQNCIYNHATATGTAGAITVAYTPAYAAWVDGMTFFVKITANNTTTTPTVSPNGLTAKIIVKGAGVALGKDDLVIGMIAELKYSADLGKVICQNPDTSGLVASGISIVTTTSALTYAMAGGLVRFNSATAITPTLPAASTYAAGKLLRLVNNNAGLATVTRAGSDTITVNSATVTSLAMGLGDTLELISDGVSSWFAVGGSVQQQYAFQFRDGTHYKFLGGGWVMQRAILPAMLMGVFPTFAYTITFPLAFTSNPYLVGTTGGFVNTNGGVLLDQVDFPTPLTGCYAMASIAATAAGFVLAFGKV